MSRALVIAWGNPLRRDDGAAWHVASRLEKAAPGIDVVCRQQLTPELAESVSRASLVIFVDASRAIAAGAVSARSIGSGGEAPSRLSHASTPAALLALARLLNGAAPPAWEIGLGIADDGPGEELSPAAAAAVTEAVARVRALL